MFTKHSKNADGTWKDFVYELRMYFQEWSKGLVVENFKQLCDLIITDQIKRRAPSEIKEYFIDEWTKFKSQELLSEKLDQYESVMQRKTASHDHRDKYSSYREKNSSHVRDATKEPNQRNFERFKNSKFDEDFLSGRKSRGVIIALPQDIFVLNVRN
ncbi:hypothetical protein AVEN_147149-1 [Araneus ventricosus]|uniref:Uncharacterized protein n=1 Tax=Araneus ventricosus TaxID=182803 RepID=A0A4Y2UET0_ARAVE|nr:hypothetical protein AVEN_230064-1 [Araneus ventricosus]GBO10126.1 hypothetical protein AVEN_147149-1 [Araneus ventricosus]